jgi:chorismate dehydratase
MIFAKIDFINLLPFYIFIKQHIKSSQIKQIINYKKSYPSKINKQFHTKKIDAAFISSIASKNCKCLDIGIVAKKEVDSVLVLTNKPNKNDFQSNTSNALAKILDIQGEVIIGDRALTYFYHNQQDENIVDLDKQCKKKYNLPFVFARLCINKEFKYINNLANKFLTTKVYIPQYILKQYAKRSELTTKQILDYLSKISYKISYKEKLSLKKFLKLSN